MKKTRKFLSIFAVSLVAVFALSCCFFAACGNKKKEETEPAHTHSYDGGVVTKEATCGEDGEMTYTCVDGDYSYTETIPATGDHTWDDGEVTTEATCGEAGETTYTCKVCGKTKNETIPATGEHTFGEWTTKTEATCVDDEVQSRTCSKCGYEETETLENTATGQHTYTQEGSTAVFTWTVDETTGKYTATAKITCAVCGQETADAVVGVEGPKDDEVYGEYTATATYDGLTFEEKKTLEDPSAVKTVDLHLDFADADSYGWLDSEFKTESKCGVLTIPANSKMTIPGDVENTLCTGGKTDSSSGIYIEIDLSDYVGQYVAITATMCSNNPSTENRTLYLDTKNNREPSTSAAGILTYATSTSQTDVKTLAYTAEIASSNSLLYFTCDKSVDIFTIDIVTSTAEIEMDHVHDYKEIWTWTATESEYEVSLTLTCDSTVGMCDAPEIKTQTAVTATLDESASTAATCTVDGQRVYTVEIELGGATHTDTRTDVVPAAHTYPESGDETHVVWDWDSTPNADKQVSVTISCSVCGETLETLTTTYSVDTSDDSLWRAEVAGANGVTYTGTHEIPDITSSSVATAEEFASVLATEGNLEITLTTNITDDASGTLLSALNTALASGDEGKTVTINLGTSTLTLDQGSDALLVGDGNTLEIVGEKDADGKNAAKLIVTQNFGGTASENLNKSNICADDGSKVTLKNIDVTANGTALYVCSGATLTVEGCNIFTTGGYGIGTNALESGNAVITLKDSSVTVQKPDGDTTTQWTARTGVFVNVPSEVTIENCVITSTFQGLVLRGGTATVTNTEIVITDDFDKDTQSSEGWENYYTADYGVGSENSWGTGNTLPHAAIVVGNNGSSAYDTPATLALDRVEIELESSNAWAIYAYSCSENIPVTITIQNCDYSIAYLGNYDLDAEGNLHVYSGVSDEGSITVNGEALAYEPDSYTIVYSCADITEEAKAIINNNESNSGDEQKGHQDGDTADLFGDGVVTYILRNGKGSVSDTCLNTGGGANGSSNATNCLKIDLFSFAGKTVTVSVEFDSNSNNANKGVALSKSQKQYSSLSEDDVLGERQTTVADTKLTVEWTREAENELDTIFFICEASLNIYTITLTIS